MIIEFPTKQERECDKLEKLLKTAFSTQEAPPELEEDICYRLKEVFDKYFIDFAVNFKIPRPKQATDEEMKAIGEVVGKKLFSMAQKASETTGGLLCEIVKMEFELFELNKQR
jgi:hypothetical protein